MLNVNNWGVSSKLIQDIDSSDKKIKIDFNDIPLFILPTGDYCFATITDNGRIEHIKIKGIINNCLITERGQDNTKARDWKKGAIIRIDWNLEQLRDYINQVVSFTYKPSNTIKGGTYDISCLSSITISDDGRIVDIN